MNAAAAGATAQKIDKADWRKSETVTRLTALVPGMAMESVLHQMACLNHSQNLTPGIIMRSFFKSFALVASAMLIPICMR